MKRAIVVQHLHVLADGSEDVKLIGVYSSLPRTRAAVERLGRMPGFSEYPGIVDPDAEGDGQGFHVDAYVVDKDHWAEGYADPD